MHIPRRLRAIGHWLAASRCVLCAGRTAPACDFCDDCERSLPVPDFACRVCALPLAHSAGGLICGQCQQHPPRYDCVRAPFRYTAPIDRLIQGGKYNGRFDWLDLLGRRLARHVGADATIDVIVPVPLHRSRLRSRGYNQSLELARPLARRLGLPLCRDIERVRATPPQAAMSRIERRRNVNNAFAANADMTGLRAAVVDDVMTSGATVDAVARCLRKSGATSVEVWVVARA